MRNIKISGGQLIGMMIWTIMGTAIISLPILIGIHAPRDAWVAAVIFTIGGIGLSLIVGALVNRFPGRHFVLYVQEVLGVWIGKLLIIVFLVWLFYASSLVLWHIANFIKVSLLRNTPIVPIRIILVLPSIYVVYGGIENLVRCSQVIFLPSIITLFLLFFLIIPDINLQNLLPVFGDGAANILRSGISPLAWAGEIMFVVFLAPYIGEIRKAAKYSAIIIISIGFGGLLSEFYHTAVFGLLRQHLTNPFYSMIRYIKPTAFIERYDILFVTTNLLGNFVKLSVFIYIFVLCLAQLLGLKSYRPLVIPSIIGLLLLTNYSAKSYNEFIFFLDTVYPFYTIPLLYGFPLIVLIVAKIRGIK